MLVHPVVLTSCDVSFSCDVSLSFVSFLLVGFCLRTTVEVFIEDHSLYSGLYTEKKKIQIRSFT
jgi:hypothetical protein